MRRPHPARSPARCVPVLAALLAVCTALLLWSAPARAVADDHKESAPAVDLPVPAGWPVADAPQVVRGFDPPPQSWAAGHRGVDLAGRVGEPVLAAAAGRVTFAGMLAGRGVVVVDHGGVRTTYEPVTAAVGVGERVQLGDRLGTLTTGTGHCDHPCLHWGLKAGERYLDPLSLVGDTAGTGPDDGRVVRLLPADAAAAAARRARERALTGGAIGVGPGGEHGFALPVAGPITSPFGMRLHPVLQVRKLHDGTDLGAACGTPIRAPADGRVIAAYYNAGYGNRLLLDHGTVDGRHVVTAMNHATGYGVGVGDRVRQGQVIGWVGQTGYATGCHLHLMVWLDGTLVDPMTWFAAGAPGGG